jgi:hypothetical protein
MSEQKNNVEVVENGDAILAFLNSSEIKPLIGRIVNVPGEGWLVDFPRGAEPNFNAFLKLLKFAIQNHGEWLGYKKGLLFPSLEYRLLTKNVKAANNSGEKDTNTCEKAQEPINACEKEPINTCEKQQDPVNTCEKATNNSEKPVNDCEKEIETALLTVKNYFAPKPLAETQVAVKLLLREGYTIEQLSERYSVSNQSIYRLANEYQDKRKTKFPDSPASTASEPT